MTTLTDVYNTYAKDPTLMKSVLTEAVMAYNIDSGSLDNRIVLTLGSTGDIQFIVDGVEGAGKLSMDSDEMLNFSGAGGTRVSGGDVNNSVVISSTRFTWDVANNTNVIDAGETQQDETTFVKRDFKLDAGNTTITGNAEINGDLITSGHFMSRSLNVGYTGSDSEVSLGFGFRVTDKETLELYKYDAGLGITQRVAVFGDGQVSRSDAYSSFPTFGAGTSGSLGAMGSGNYTSNAQGVGYGTSFWNGDGANIFYQDGKVVIGAETITHPVNTNEPYDLEVYRKAWVNDGLDIGEGGLRMYGNSVDEVEHIKFYSRSNYDVKSGTVKHFPETVFNGRLSSLIFDEMPYGGFNTDDIWWSKAQNAVALKDFWLGIPASNNEFTLGHMFHGNEITPGVYTNPNGKNSVWFDNAQNTVKVADFDVSDTLLDPNFAVDSITVENVMFSSSNVSFAFDGTVSTLQGFEEFAELVTDGLTHKDTFSIGSLTLSNIATDLLPDETSAVPINVGASETPFHTGFFENGVVVGTGSNVANIVMNASNVIEMSAPLKLTSEEGIIFADGSKLISMGSEGGETNAVEGMSYQFYDDSNVYRVSAKIAFMSDREGVPGSELYKSYMYELSDSALIVPDSTGTVFGDMDNPTQSTSVSTFQSTNIDINLFDETGEVRNKMILAAYKPSSINDIIDINTLVPNSTEFNQKFFADFNYFFNTRLKANPNNRVFKETLPYGYFSGEKAYPGFSKFVRDSLTDFSNKHVMEFISYVDVPFADEVGLSRVDANYFSNMLSQMNDRFNGRYLTFDEDDLATMKNDHRLFPKIAFKRWTNDRLDTLIEIVPHPNTSGWGYVNTSDGVVNPAQIDDAWKKQLLTLTFSHIKYGTANTLSEADEQKINAINLANLTASHFVSIQNKFGPIFVKNALRVNSASCFVIDGNDLNVHSSLL